MAIFKKTKKRRPEDSAADHPAPKPIKLSPMAEAGLPSAAEPKAAGAPKRAATGGGGGGGGKSVIGAAIRIRGEVTCKGDLVVDGAVEGTIEIRDHHLEIGDSGRVQAALVGRTVTVRGQVIGDVTALEKIEVGATGTVVGDICAPRVSLADGSSFTGSINKTAEPAVMGPAPSSPIPKPSLPQASEHDRPAATAGWTLEERRSKDRPWSDESGV